MKKVFRPLVNITILVAMLLSIMSPLLNSPVAEAAPPPDFQSTPIITTGLNGPSGFDIAPDGRIFILERTGAIKIYKNGQLLPTPFAELPSIAAGDRGLIGIAFDPEFSINCYVYFYYTSADDLLNRLVRFSACGDVGTDGPFVVYQTNSPSQELHVGGSIRFGADGKMYFAVGDNGYPPNGQDLANPHGKILRINKDGSIPTDNPFYGQPGKLGEIWAYGFRNPWRFQFDSATNQLYGGDVGDYSWEEVNHIVKGGNYGWPLKEGYCAPNCEGTIEPIYAYPHSGFSAAVTGGPVYRGDVFPEEYRGDLFFADYAMGFIKHMDLGPNGENLGVSDFDTGAGSVVDLKVAPDGSMYYLTYWPGRLYRITYDTGNTVPTANATADITKGQEPLTVNFSSAGSSDPDGDPITYLWDFDDGTTSTEANPTKTFTAKGTYEVELTVSDGTNFAQAVPVVIQVGIPPTVRISVPAEGYQYVAGEQITYNAFANDAAGFDLNDAAISTDVHLHHDTHTHPFVDDMIGRANTFTIPDYGESAANTWYRIVTTATDANGLTATAERNIYPKVVNINFQSDKPGIGVVVDGVPRPAPYNTQGVTGFKRELSATPVKQGSDSIFYQFSHWSNGGAVRHNIVTPATDVTYTAHYTPATPFKAEYFDNAALEGAPILERDEFEISHDWGDGAADPTLPADNFSARWTKQQYFAPGRYKFTTSSDDGTRLYIDGQLVVDSWFGVNQGQTVVMDMTDGLHDIRYEYNEIGGGATVRLSWDTTPDQPASPAAQYAAEYFNNMNLAGAPIFTRNETSINHDWGMGSPDATINVDGFSARWTKSETFEAGTYEFTVAADDGIRLFIDDEQVIDGWVDQGTTTYTATKALTAGSHTLRIEYYENGGGAVATFSYQKISDTPPPPPPPGDYLAKYWNLVPGTPAIIPAREPDLSRSDPAIDFTWDMGSPAPAINPDNFVAQWTKTAAFTAGTYGFSVTSDDGIRVYLDDEVIIDRWFDQGVGAPYTVNRTVSEGDHTLRIEYYENGGGAVATFSYAATVAPPTGDYQGKYWNLAAGAAAVIPTTEPQLIRTDATINFNWGGGSPAPAINPDNFVAQWTKSETFEAATYEFTVTADDGVRLYIDDVLLIDKWIDQAPTTYKASKSMTAGSHSIRMEYYEKAGGATATMSFSKTSENTPPDDPAAIYNASYWNISPTATPIIPTTAPTLTRTEQSVNHDWAGGSPAPEVTVDWFAARWQHHNHNPGTYRFTVTADDGVRIFANDELILDKWIDQAPTTYTIEKTFAAHWDLTVEYYEKTGGAVAKVSYAPVTTTPPATSGFAASYWNTPTAGTSPVVPTRAADFTRTDPTINFIWDMASPDASISNDHFIARWVRQLDLSAGTYRFTTESDDGIRVYVNGVVIIDEWNDHASTVHTGDVLLAAGTHEIVVEYYENTGGAVAKVTWETVATP